MITNGWNYTNADTQLAKQFQLELRFSAPGCDGRRTSRIEFQFPPKVIGDGRKGDWFEQNVRGDEPAAGFTYTGPREITLNWTYVVDGDQWTVDRITSNIRTLRGYFMFVDKQTPGSDGKLKIDINNMVLKLRMWCIGGSGWMSGRLKSVDVKYGETMIITKGTSTPGKHLGADGAFPLRSDISVDLRLWTQGYTMVKGKAEGKAIELVDKCQKGITQDWY